MSRAVDRALVAALALCMAGGGVVFWGHEHWWVLAALQGVVLWSIIGGDGLAGTAEGAKQADVVSGVTQGPRKPVTKEEWTPGTEGDEEEEGAPPAGNGESEQNPRESAQAPPPETPEQALSKRATSVSDDSGDLVALVRGLKSVDGGLSEDRMLLAAEAIGALFSAPGGISVRQNAALVIRELEGGGIDAGKMLAEVAAVSARDRAEVAARELQEGLKNVLAQVHRMAAATTSRVDVHLRGFDERAQGALSAAVLVQTLMDQLERNGRKVVARVDDVHRSVESLDSVVRGVRVEVEGAAEARERLVENAGVVGRGVWWYALVGGVLGGALSGLFTGLVQRAVAGL